MATINQEATEQATGKSTKKASHFINISILKEDGTTLRLGSIAVYEDGDKTHRTVAKAFADGFDFSTLALVADVRSAEKSTDVDDVNTWATTKIVEA